MESFTSSSFRHYGQKRQPSPIANENASTHAGRGGAAISEETGKILAQKMADLSTRLVAKDELASQQSRIAKDAIEDLIKKDEQLRQHVRALKEETSAREKAEAGHLSVQQELDKVYQQKGVVEARMMQLNGALQDCMDEMRHAKDQLESKNQETTSRKREWDKLRNELEAENALLKRQLMEATAENIAMSKSLQEHRRNLNEINETRAKAESESKILQVQIESLHKDMDAYKYEIHVLKKELQIRSEEKEQNMKLADATHKQHLESVKKIAKLESECNRLRALVRKKLPGPAVIAQMRVEGDHVGKKRMPSLKISSDQRDMEALNARLMAMEEETKLLKESLAKKTAELQVARQLCTHSASKLLSAEGIVQAMARGEPLPTLWCEEIPATLCGSKSDPMQQQRFTLSETLPGGGSETMEVIDWALSSEDGNNNDDELSSAKSWASALIAKLSHLRKGDVNRTTKADEPGYCVTGPVVLQDYDLQTAWQELTIKLASIGESILALPSSMTCMGDQGSGNGTEIKPLSFGMLGKIMEEFTCVKQLLAELQKAIELQTAQLQVIRMGRSVQGSNTNKRDGALMINADLAEIDSEKETYKGLVRKVMEALLESVEIINRNSESEAEGAFIRLQTVMDALDGVRDLHNLSEVVAVELLCKIGHLIKEQGNASWVPPNVVDGRGDIVISGDRGDNTAAAEDEFASGIDESDGTFKSGKRTEVMVMHSSCNALDGNNGSGFYCVDEAKLDVHKIALDRATMLDISKNGVDSEFDKQPDAGEVQDKLNSVNMELLQHEVERLTVERDELAAKLAASEEQLEQQLARIATLDTESVLQTSEKVSLAQQLSEAAARNQGLEEDLAEARANLDDLRQQVSSLTSELADQSARCQELQGNVMALSDVGTPPTGRTYVEGDADGKHRKEREIASAKAQLAECQRTILVLGSQLRALSSVQDRVAAEPSFDSSLESATSTGQINLPPMPLVDSYASGHVAELNNRSRSGYVRTRGGRLVSADQYWGFNGDVSVGAGGESQGAPSHTGAGCSYSSRHSSRHTVLPRHLYGAVGAQSPLHEYVTEQSTYAYSPPETALSSPATSPARFNLQLDRGLKTPPPSSPAVADSLLTATRKSSGGSSVPGFPSARRGSRIARFFLRAKNQR